MIAQYPSGRVAYLRGWLGQYPSGRVRYLRDGLGRLHQAILPELPTKLPPGRAETISLPAFTYAPVAEAPAPPPSWFDRQWIPGVPNYWLLLGGLFGMVTVMAGRVR